VPQVSQAIKVLLDHKATLEPQVLQAIKVPQVQAVSKDLTVLLV
jgi:hypothetical protein